MWPSIPLQLTLSYRPRSRRRWSGRKRESVGGSCAAAVSLRSLSDMAIGPMLYLGGGGQGACQGACQGRQAYMRLLGSEAIGCIGTVRWKACIAHRRRDTGGGSGAGSGQTQQAPASADGWTLQRLDRAQRHRHSLPASCPAHLLAGALLSSTCQMCCCCPPDTAVKRWFQMPLMLTVMREPDASVTSPCGTAAVPAHSGHQHSGWWCQGLAMAARHLLPVADTWPGSWHMHISWQMHTSWWAAAIFWPAALQRRHA